MREKPRRSWHERRVRGPRAGIARCSRSRCSSQKRSVARWSGRGDSGGTHQDPIVHFLKENTGYWTGNINSFPPTSSDQDYAGATQTMVAASSYHPGGVNALFMDGSVHFIKSSVNYQAYYAIATPDNNETFSADAL